MICPLCTDGTLGVVAYGDDPEWLCLHHAYRRVCFTPAPEPPFEAPFKETPKNVTAPPIIQIEDGVTWPELVAKTLE